VNLRDRIRQLEAQRIEAAANLERTAARLDALEATVAGLVAFLHQDGRLERLWTCPRCGFLAQRAGLCGGCDGDGAGELEENVDDYRS